VRTALADAVRRVPGGPAALDARRRAAEELRRRLRPARPPYRPPEKVAALSETPADERFITGNGFAARCRWVLNYDVLTVNEHVDNDWWFCKSDYLEHFFAEHAPREPFVLFTHNSDRPIGRRFRRALERPSLVAWFAQNPTMHHRKLHAIPIGLSNPFWPHGDQSALARVQDDPPEKTRTFDVSFNVDNNPQARLACLEQTGLELEPRVPYPEYLRRLASSRFCISPEGNGIDCVRTWEALYVGTIPVVTRSLVTDHHRDVPLVVLDDWSQFRSIEFTPELYRSTWGDWSPDAIRLDRYLERVEATIARLRAPAGEHVAPAVG
jgi:hypothetical protein